MRLHERGEGIVGTANQRRRGSAGAHAMRPARLRGRYVRILLSRPFLVRGPGLTTHVP